jgi:hypothetical protein
METCNACGAGVVEDEYVMFNNFSRDWTTTYSLVVYYHKAGMLEDKWTAL